MRNSDVGFETNPDLMSEEKLKLLEFSIDIISDAVYWVTLDGRFWNINMGACRMLGYSRAELLVMSILDIDPTYDPADAQSDIENVKRTGSIRLERSHTTRDGRVIPVEITSNYFTYNGVDYICAVARDVSERKRMEEELQQAHDELEKRVEERTLALLNANELLQHEIYERNRTENVITARLRLLRFAETHTLDELLEATLDEASALTGSLIGFYHFLEADQKTLSLQNWSTRTKKEFCNAEGKRLHYDIAAAGVWVDCIYERRPVIHNDYASLPHRRGLPPGHAPVVRELVVPVFRGESIVAILGVGNRQQDYTTQDVETVSLLADLAWEIAERKRAEENLRQANLVVENSPVVVFRWNADDVWPVELVSKNIIQFGYTPEEFLSGAITYCLIIHPEDLERVTGEVHDFCNEGAEQFRLEYRIITKGGDIRWVNEHTNVERNAAGCINNFQGIIIDVTERKLVEEQLRQQKKKLEELNRTLEKRVQEEVTKNREKDIVLIQQNRQAALGEMLDNIAHQWKQPLNSMYLIIQDLNESWSCRELTDENVEEAVEKTMALVEHMVQTIDVFRNFYRPEKEQVVFRLKNPIDCALSFMAPTLRSHGIAIEIDLDPDLSAIGYPNEYAQVLLNILTNARDTFKERNVDKPVLKIEAFAENDKAVVAITDNAGGIPESIIDKIFDLYFTTRESKDGSGIGLYMSKKIIEKNMRGKLSAENIDGGAQFRIEIIRTGC